MYIPEFWAGVGITLFCEFVLICVVVLLSIRGGSKKDEDNGNPGDE